MDVKEIIDAVGGPSRLGQAIGRRHVTVLRWHQVPAEHVRAVAKLAGLHPSEVRPDLYDPPEPLAGPAPSRPAPPAPAPRRRRTLKPEAAA